jgi:hypothetical protein
MNVPKLHPTGLHPNSLAALVLDFMASTRLGLLGLAAAADVIAADWPDLHLLGVIYRLR